MNFFLLAHNDSRNNLQGRHESWVICQDSRVMNHYLAVTPKPLNQLSWNFFWWFLINNNNNKGRLYPRLQDFLDSYKGKIL